MKNSGENLGQDLILKMLRWGGGRIWPRSFQANAQDRCLEEWTHRNERATGCVSCHGSLFPSTWNVKLYDGRSSFILAGACCNSPKAGTKKSTER